ncbi:hypothetical protein Bca101_004958 [Brassica carinata]
MFSRGSNYPEPSLLVDMMNLCHHFISLLDSIQLVSFFPATRSFSSLENRSSLTAYHPSSSLSWVSSGRFRVNFQVMLWIGYE